MEKENWIIHNRTFIFGGGEVWQPDCNKTRTEILSGFTTKPDEFLPNGKCFGRLVGKVMGDVCTPLLQEGVAFVESIPENMKIGLGHGGMLGGLDKEMTWIPVDESKCKEAEALDEKRKELESWDLSKKIPDVYFAPSTLQEAEGCKKYKENIEKIDKPILDAIRKCFLLEDGKFINKSPSAISAKITTECDLAPFRISDNITELVERGITNPETVKSELKNWGKTMRDIKKVYHNTETPFIIETKDGQRFLVAPRVGQKSDDCYSVESHIKYELRKKAEAINNQIEELASKRLEKVY
jgi:gas vesicle protein